MSTGTNTDTRTESLRRLAESPLDLLVVGGGIVGAGIARDAAMRGMRIGLVEQHDFAFGTSSRSSRLIHGGLRYLAQGRIGLVREASLEKNVLQRIAPHLTQPLPFIFPTFSDNRDWVLWQLKIGVKIYDLLCSGRNLGKSTWLDRQQLQAMLPNLRSESLNGAVRYFDGLTSDARLAIDTIRSAVRSGALALNYCRFESATRTPGGNWKCELLNLPTGKKIFVEARGIVNATGPWSERMPHSRIKLRLTKGVHLVVDQQRLSVPETVVMTSGKRILFAIPWGLRTILGTTDTDYFGSLDSVRADATDIGYVLEITNKFFPKAHLTPADVISSWAGLRPLVADPNGNPSDISRSHEIHEPEPGWWDVAGGKLTTYRLMAEQTIDRVVARLAGNSHGFSKCRTQAEPLLPASETFGVSSVIPPELSKTAVVHYVNNEWAIHLDDVMVRRSSWYYYWPDAAEKVRQVVEWMGELLTWDAARREAELERYRRAVALSPENSKTTRSSPAC